MKRPATFARSAQPISIAIAMGAALLHSSASVMAAPPTSITLDGSMGHGSGAITPTSANFYQIPSASGKTVGPNLFQSFGTFNLGTGDTASFQSGGAANIIARVTGGSASSIDGILQAQANLFFINPAGVMFGANAQIDVTGAFTVSTANYVKFSDGGIFYSQLGGPNDNLTSAPVSAFGFLGTPSPISFTGTQLTNAGGIHLIGGDLTFDQSTLLAPSGNLTLFSAASAGEAPFTLASPGTGYANATNPTFGNITVQNQSLLSIDGAGGGIIIRGGKMTVDNSKISAANNISGQGASIFIRAESLTLKNATSATHSTTAANSTEIVASTSSTHGNAGDVTISVTNALTIDNGAAISCSTLGNGNAGTATISAGSLAMDGYYTDASENVHPSEIISTSGADEIPGTVYGGAGTVTASIIGAMSLTNGAVINTSTYENGDAGFATVTMSDSLTISGVANSTGSTYGVLSPSGIFSATYGSGAAGKVDLTTTHELRLIDGGEVNVATFGPGDPGLARGKTGFVEILNAGSIGIDGEKIQLSQIDPSLNLAFASGIYTNTNAGSVEDAGNIQLIVRESINLTNGGTMDLSAAGNGNGGSLSLRVQTFNIDGGFYNSAVGFHPSGVVATVSVGGHSGNINTTTEKTLTITNGGALNVGTSNGIGNAGNVMIDQGSLIVDGAYKDPQGNTHASEIESSSRGAGVGGMVSISDVKAVSLTNGGLITASTFAAGKGGDVTVESESLTIDGGSFDSGSGFTPSGIYSKASGAGNGGNVKVVATGDVSLTNGAQISAFSALSNAGTVELTAANLTLSGNSAIKTSAPNGDGNNLTLKMSIGGTMWATDSEITASALLTGGNITIDPKYVVLDNNPITAFGGVDNGRILIETSYFFASNSPVEASGGLTISAPDLDLSGSLIPFRVVVSSDENRLRERCARSLQSGFSSFIEVGRGGTESGPTEVQADFGDDALPLAAAK